MVKTLIASTFEPTIPLALAALCANCEMIFSLAPARDGHVGCTACGSQHFVPVERRA